MRPSGRVAGKLIDEQGKPLADYSVSLTGPDLPPSSSVIGWTQADAQGRFTLEDVPTIYRFPFAVRKAEVKPPWNDSWASAAMRFERPDGGDLRAWFGDREIRLRELVLRVAGPGVHQRIAGNAGLLHLTAADPSEVEQPSDRRIVARSAVLTLRNSPGQDRARSLISDWVPVAPAERSSTRLARTRPNAAGEFVISSENPRGFDLEPGKHRVIFQVFAGASREPIRETISRQLDARREGRYREAVKIRPECIADSRVSITLVTIQPEHDKWVRSFFMEGKETSYKGLWAGDGGLMPGIPFEADDHK